MKTILSVLTFLVVMSGIVNAQTYYPEWRYFPTITLSGNADTETLEIKYAGSETEIIYKCVGVGGTDTVGSFTISNWSRLRNSSTVFDTALVSGQRVDTTPAPLITTFASTVSSITSHKVYALNTKALDKVVFTKDAATNNTITIYVRQRSLVRKP